MADSMPVLSFVAVLVAIVSGVLSAIWYWRRLNSSVDE
jgi:hypothetical protein